jgi:HAD superfamily phosphatase
LDIVEIQALFFDMDGVLVNVSRSYRRAIEQTVSHFTGRDIEGGTIQRYKNLGGFNDDWKLTHAIVSDAGISVSFGRIIEEFQKHYRGENWDGFIAEEEPMIKTRTLDELGSGQRVLGVVTGRPGAEANWTIDRFGWKKYFPLVIPKEKQEGREKPDPYPLQRALAILDAAGRKTEPEASVYVGDSVDDMKAARAAGMWAIGVVPPYLDAESHTEVLEGAGAHHVILDPNTLLEVMENFVELVVPEPVSDEEDEATATE